MTFPWLSLTFWIKIPWHFTCPIHNAFVVFRSLNKHTVLRLINLIGLVCTVQTIFWGYGLLGLTRYWVLSTIVLYLISYPILWKKSLDIEKKGIFVLKSDILNLIWSVLGQYFDVFSSIVIMRHFLTIKFKIKNAYSYFNKKN